MNKEWYEERLDKVKELVKKSKELLKEASDIVDDLEIEQSTKQPIRPKNTYTFEDWLLDLNTNIWDAHCKVEMIVEDVLPD